MENIESTSNQALQSRVPSSTWPIFSCRKSHEHHNVKAVDLWNKFEAPIGMFQVEADGGSPKYTFPVLRLLYVASHSVYSSRVFSEEFSRSLLLRKTK